MTWRDIMIQPIPLKSTLTDMSSYFIFNISGGQNYGLLVGWGKKYNEKK